MFGIFKRKKNDKVLRIRVSAYYLTDVDKSLKILKKVLSPTSAQFEIMCHSIKEDGYFTAYVSKKEYAVLSEALEGKMCLPLQRYANRDEGSDREIRT